MQTKENVISEYRVKEFIPLTEDRLFKETFSRKNNHRYLEDLLESYFGFESSFLHNKLNVKYENYLPKTNYYDKDFRSDLVVTFLNVIVNIEMYSIFTDESLKKSSQYVMRIYATQLGIGDSYNDVKKVTQINFVDNVRMHIAEDIKSSTYIGDVTQDIVRLDIARHLEYNEGDNFFYGLNL